MSLPRNYPAESPPQLQLLSRYIGSFGVDAELFGSVIRLFMSKGGIVWVPNNVCVFDGMESVRELCAKWYAKRLDEDGLARSTKLSSHTENTPPPLDGPRAEAYCTTSEIASLPNGIHVIEAEPITDRKSVFIGRVCRINDPSQVSFSE